MIVGDRFVWIHFPKCAGTEVENVLRACAGSDGAVKFDKIDPSNVIWHHSIYDRQRYDANFSVGGRDVICNIRRLPAWLLSRIHYEKTRSPDLIVTREMLLAGEFFEYGGIRNRADAYMRTFTKYPVTHWIRTEHLVEDFRAIFSKYVDCSAGDVEALFVKRNATQMGYIKDIDFYFTKHELRQLYEANPCWAEVEAEVYGDLDLD